MSFFGGKCEVYDEDLWVIVFWEVEEEVGVDFFVVNFLGVLFELYILVSNFKV